MDGEFFRGGDGKQFGIEQFEPGRFRIQHPSDERDVCVTIAMALGELTELDAIDIIEDFTQYADPDALNQLFRSVPNGPPRDTTGEVVLHIEGYRVTVYGDGEIHIGIAID